MVTTPRTGRFLPYTPPGIVVELRPGEVFADLSPSALLALPPRFFAAGETALLRLPSVAVIGSRSTGPQGLMRARKLATLLAAAGVVVVSGLAKGVDRAAHEAAMAAGGRTIAVIGTPLDRAYPAEHGALQQRIYEEHLVLSQFAPGSRVYPSNFLQRNSTMARLSDLTVIVEAGDTSGTLNQARETMRLGKRLFLMKSLLDRTDLTWPMKFVADGAVILSDAAELLGVLPHAPVHSAGGGSRQVRA